MKEFEKPSMADAPAPFKRPGAQSGLGERPGAAACRSLPDRCKDVAQPDAILLRSADLHGARDPGRRARHRPRRRRRQQHPGGRAQPARGVPVFNTPGANANAVKELVLAGMLLAARNLPAALDFVRTLDVERARSRQARRRAARRPLPAVELAGQTLGVVGLGKIGCLVADAAIKPGHERARFRPRDHRSTRPGAYPRRSGARNSVAEVLRESPTS